MLKRLGVKMQIDWWWIPDECKLREEENNARHRGCG
jgi:hypothetical protein